jgi:oligosaccharide repeat unit polymerase
MKHRRLSVATLLPVVANGAAFFVLGGRARSFTPIACALLMAWYVILNRQLNRKWFLRVTALALLLITFSYAGGVYRGKGLSELPNIFSLSNIIAYTQNAVWVEFGQLHGLAGATKIEPGALGGKSFVGALGIAKGWLGLSSRNSGVLIAQKIKRDENVNYGYHSSFIGDSYLNYGYLGIVLLGVVFGALMRSIYRVGVRMLGNPIGLTFYAITMVYSFRLFFESINKTMEMQFALFFLVSGLLVVRLFRHDPEHA